jgi:5'-3' exonuclease
MGIPLFFKILSEKYDNCVNDTIDNIQALFLDMNGLIHPCTARALDENYSHKYKDKYEQRMLNEIENEIKRLINMTKANFIYMAIDGVAPAAKMKQQRLRRFKTIVHNRENLEILEKCNMPIPEDTWDKNCISPGTEFMEKVTRFIKNMIFEDPYFNEKRVILNDSLIPGEGEHKLLEFIRNTEFQETSNIVIHGLDADLIMLSMASHQNNIYLLRDQYDEIIYFDIDTMKSNIIMDFKERYFMGNPNGYIPPEKYINIINDYIFICFFLGNDFLPHILGLDLRYNGLDIILDNYVQSYILINGFITNVENKQINTQFMKIFLSRLNNNEQTMVNTIFNKRKKLRRHFKINATNDYEKYQALLNNKPTMTNPDEDFIINDNLYINNWRNRYYLKACGEINQLTIDSMCNNYIEGLMWVFNYYFYGCSNWEWKYEFESGPLLSSLFKYFNKNVHDINKEFKLAKNKPCNHFVQLLCILPFESKDILPIGLHKFFNDSYLYPKTYELNTLFKRYYWECEPKIPNFDIQEVKTIISQNYKKFAKKDHSVIIVK